MSNKFFDWLFRKKKDDDNFEKEYQDIPDDESDDVPNPVVDDIESTEGV